MLIGRQWLELVTWRMRWAEGPSRAATLRTADPYSSRSTEANSRHKVLMMTSKWPWPRAGATPASKTLHATTSLTELRTRSIKTSASLCPSEDDLSGKTVNKQLKKKFKKKKKKKKKLTYEFSKSATNWKNGSQTLRSSESLSSHWLIRSRLQFKKSLARIFEHQSASHDQCQSNQFHPFKGIEMNWNELKGIERNWKELKGIELTTGRYHGYNGGSGANFQHSPLSGIFD